MIFLFFILYTYLEQVKHVLILLLLIENSISRILIATYMTEQSFNSGRHFSYYFKLVGHNLELKWVYESDKNENAQHLFHIFLR